MKRVAHQEVSLRYTTQHRWELNSAKFRPTLSAESMVHMRHVILARAWHHSIRVTQRDVLLRRLRIVAWVLCFVLVYACGKYI